MKSKFAASFYLYYAGKCWRNTISSRSTITLFNRRHFRISSSFQAQGFEHLRRAVHSSALSDDLFSELGPEISELPAKKIEMVTEKPDDIVDDDFSELGPGISESSSKKMKLVTDKTDDFMDDDFSVLGSGISESSVMQIKLVTEKPDPVAKAHPRRKELSIRPPSSRSNVNEILATIGHNSKTSGPKLHSHGHAPTVTDDTRKISDIERPCSVSIKDIPSRKISDIERPRSVSIKNIPSTVGLPELVDAISVFGKVSGASFGTASNSLRHCTVEFEDVESSRRATSSGKVTVGSQVFPVDPLNTIDLVAVRIKNINEKTADYEIHTMCKSVGDLVGLTRTSKDCVDAFFNVRNHTIHLDIVKKLNNTTVDLNRWSAHVVTTKSKSSEVLSHEEARYKSGLQIFNRLSNLKRQLNLKKVYSEDLEYLTASILHVEALQSATNRSASTSIHQPLL